MNSSFYWIDILFLAIVALVLFKRLFDTLGTHEENELEKEQQKVLAQEVSDIEPSKNSFSEETPFMVEEKTPLNLSEKADMKTKIKKLIKLDPSFDPQEFIDGAKMAFEIILESYAKGDKKMLRDLLENKIYQTFCENIDTREKEKQVMENEIIRFVQMQITNVHLKKELVQIEVKITTEQVSSLKDEKGKILEGDPNRIDMVSDIWIFQRHIKSKDPNWTLVETDYENE